MIKRVISCLYFRNVVLVNSHFSNGAYGQVGIVFSIGVTTQHELIYPGVSSNLQWITNLMLDWFESNVDIPLLSNNIFDIIFQTDDSLILNISSLQNGVILRKDIPVEEGYYKYQGYYF